MKMLLWISLICPIISFAQDGIQFVHADSWKQVLAKAKGENKYIFVDAFTTWCGPCKEMSANIFPKKEVGDFFNKNFVNLKLQIDTTRKDDDHVKKWYFDAHTIETKYSIKSYPTYLFFSPDGKLVHRAVGSSDAEEFLVKGANALDPEMQYYTLLNKYTAKNKDAELLQKLAYASMEVHDKQKMEKFSNEYLETQKELFTPDNIKFIEKFTNASTDKGFNIILSNPEKFDRVHGNGSASKKLVNIILSEFIKPVIFSLRSSDTPNWLKLRNKISDKIPTYANEVIASAKTTYYLSKKDWTNFQTAVVDYMKNYGSNESPEQLNKFAWAVFDNCSDMACVKEALGWSRRSSAENNIPMYIDTYANLLYKLGMQKEAISFQEKAISLVDESYKGEFQEILEKMKKGEKTWKN